MRDKIFYAISFGFVFGIFLRSFIFVDLYLATLFGIISFALILFFIFISKNKWGNIFGFFVLAILFGIFRFHIFENRFLYVFDSVLDKKVTLSGFIIDEPSIGENNQKLIVEIIKNDKKVKVLLATDFTEEYKYGDEIKFSGKIEEPENFTTDYGKEFDYINYLKKDGILYVMSFPKVEIISSGNGNKIKTTLFFIKEKFLEKINYSIKEPESLLMGGLVLGEKASFDQALRESFINTGTIHIVALSGYNITIIAEWIMKLFSFLPINFSIGFGIGSIILFILMTGGSTTAIRAGTMAVLALVARATGRNYDVARALILAGVFMIFFNPLILIYDVSFQLSFIATIAVIFIAPRVEKYFTWVTKKFGLRDIISVTFAAYIFVMPFILYKMGTLSIVAFPANILILPFIPFTMALGFLTGLVGFISNIFALPFGIISYIFLHYELFIISLFSKLPFSSFSIPNFPLILTVLIYIYFVYKIFGRDIRKFLVN